MKLEPTAIVLYVNNLSISSHFYEDILGIIPEATSPSFHTFKLSNGMDLGLKAKYALLLPANEKSNDSELAFTVDNNNKVDVLFAIWQEKKVNIALPPTIEPYGYTFIALDPDLNRLRVVGLGNQCR